MAIISENFFNDALVRETVTIANGQTISTQKDTRGASIVMIDLPAGIQGTFLRFLVSIDNGVTFKQYFNSSGKDVKVNIAGGIERAIGICAADFLPTTTIKLFSDLPQIEDIEIGLIVRGVV